MTAAPAFPLPSQLAYAPTSVKKLKPWPKNPRKIDKTALERLKRDMALDPAMLEVRPLVALPDMTVFMGNMRLRAAQDLGWETIPCAIVDLDWNVAERWALRDNNEYGTWEDQAVAEILSRAHERGDDVTTYGFWEPDLAKLWPGPDSPRQGLTDDALRTPPANPITRPGDVWLLESCRFMCGDCRDAAQVARLFGGRRARLVVTSPPYNQQIETFKPSGMHKEHPSAVHRLAGAYDDTVDEPAYQRGQIDLLDSLAGVLRPDGSVFYNHKHRFRDGVVVSPWAWLLKLQSLHVREEIVWDHVSGFAMNAKMFTPVDERIYWLAKDQRPYFSDTSEARGLTNIWRIPPRNEEQASVPFPNELPRRIIDACSERGDMVYDPYHGSGTTGVVAWEQGRVGYGMELDPANVDVQVERWMRHSRQDAIRESDGASYADLLAARGERG